MSVRSHLYSLLQSSHDEQKKRFDRKFKSKFKKKLPKISIDYHNRLFREVSNYIKPIIQDAEIPFRFKTRAIKIYDFQLGKESTLIDLLSSDAFFAQTPNQDFKIDEIFKGSRGKISNNHHFCFHRAQQTEFLFFHEVIVGHLVNAISENPRFLKRSELAISSDYFHLSSYVFKMFCDLLDLSPEQLIGLHVVDSNFLKAKLPQSFQELIHITTHLAWYLEILNYYVIQAPTAEILSILYTHFTIPLLERIKRNAKLKPIKKAHQIIDSQIMAKFFEREDGFEPNQNDLLKLLTNFSEKLWA